jgi:4-amino-4-deoxy-L-arabinose transferase-like glycosyltransferase
MDTAQVGTEPAARSWWVRAFARSTPLNLRARRTPCRQKAMPEAAVFALATCVAALMLIASMRALTWHKVSPFLTSILLLLVVVVTWLILARGKAISFEQGLLFTLCGMVGMVAGLVRGQNAPMRFEPGEGDVLCRRGGLLIFCWAAVVVVLITLLTVPGLRAPTWEAILSPTLVFLTAAFIISTLTIFARVSTLRREHLSQLEQERLAQERLAQENPS